jgi:hypothetical protein
VGSRSIQRGRTRHVVDGKDFRLAGELRYIQEKAVDHSLRMVTIGQLILFSTETGDAWLLDVADKLAARLAANGAPERIHMEETDSSFAIGWKGHDHIDGTAFVYSDRDTRRVTTIIGYPAKNDLSSGLIWNFKISLASFFDSPRRFFSHLQADCHDGPRSI